MDSKEKIIEKVQVGGKDLILESGQLAGLADGAVVARQGDTVVLATAVVEPEPDETATFFPLLVDYEERLYAAGKISGSRFIKREGRPSEEAVLTARLVDRPIRPLFPKDFRNKIQIVITVLSYDGENDPDVLSIIAGSAALLQTTAPFEGPVGAVRVGTIDDKLVLNPSRPELEKSFLDLVIAGTPDRILMLEAVSKEVPEEKVLQAIEFGLKNLLPSIKVQEKFRNPHRMELETVLPEAEMKLKEAFGSKIKKAVGISQREKREEEWTKLREEVLAHFEGDFKQTEIALAFDKALEEEVRTLIIEKGMRPDGRGLKEIRPLESQVGLLPRTHGSALFSRGETQALTIATLGAPGEEQLIETMETEGTKRFMHHYNFPPFSTGEVRPLRSPSRREVGHGALAEKALLQVIPDRESFPYTIRLVSEILSSNGSTSMAAVSGSSLALMDAGVPIKGPVAGVAVGMVSRKTERLKDIKTVPTTPTAGRGDRDPDRSVGKKQKDGKLEYKLLTDIQGIEDFGGDMDLKVTGTAKGITAIQLDVKIKELTLAILKEAVSQAKEARMQILEVMKKTLPAPRAELSPYAPRITKIQISPDKIGEVIGPGGKMIHRIIEASGGKELVSIDIEEDGTVLVSSPDSKAAEKAVVMIQSITTDPEVGKIYPGVVSSIKKDRFGKEIGALVKVGPHHEGLVHISEIQNERVPSVSSVLQPGQSVSVKVVSLDKEKGRIALSIKQANQ